MRSAEMAQGQTYDTVHEAVFDTPERSWTAPLKASHSPKSDSLLLSFPMSLLALSCGALTP